MLQSNHHCGFQLFCEFKAPSSSFSIIYKNSKPTEASDLTQPTEIDYLFVMFAGMKDAEVPTAQA